MDNKEEEEDMRIVIVDEESDELVKDGVEGELWVSSPSNASGYLGHPDLTREIFYGRPKEIGIGRCFVRTGDRGIVLGEDRFLFVTGRCSDMIRLLDANNGEKVELHPHYLETAAYNAFPRILRGGCMAAFMDSGKVTIVVEMQKKEGEREALRRICEGIRDAIWREEKVEVGKVVLVRSGCIPKTTSGKIMRWAAKEKLAGGGMNVIADMEFRAINGKGSSSLMKEREVKVSEEGQGKRANKNGRIKVSHEGGEETMADPLSSGNVGSNSSRRPLISLL